MINYERDITKAKKGDTDDLAYKKIAGFNEDLTAANKPEILQEDASESGSESSSEGGNDDDDRKLFIIINHNLSYWLLHS